MVSWAAAMASSASAALAGTSLGSSPAPNFCNSVKSASQRLCSPSLVWVMFTPCRASSFRAFAQLPYRYTISR